MRDTRTNRKTNIFTGTTLFIAQRKFCLLRPKLLENFVADKRMDGSDGNAAEFCPQSFYLHCKCHFGKTAAGSRTETKETYHSSNGRWYYCKGKAVRDRNSCFYIIMKTIHRSF